LLLLLLIWCIYIFYSDGVSNYDGLGGGINGGGGIPLLLLLLLVSFIRYDVIIFQIFDCGSIFNVCMNWLSYRADWGNTKLVYGVFDGKDYVSQISYS